MDFGLDTFDDAVTVVIGNREIKVGNGAVALGANSGHRNLGTQAVRIAHLEGMAAGQGKRWSVRWSGCMWQPTQVSGTTLACGALGITLP